MTEQTPADLADKVRKLAARFRQQMEPHTPAAECSVWECAAEAVETLLSPPPRPTLADMTPEERAMCAWMQADVKRGRAIITTADWVDGHAELIDRQGDVFYEAHTYITPRPDLPRMEWPGEKKPTPAPALPDGWRLAEHPVCGRVIVTSPASDRNGHVYVVRPTPAPRGYEWLFCATNRLTYLDQEADQ